MVRRRANEWLKIRRDAVQQAEKLCAKGTTRVPVDLREVATQRRINEIRFRRLLVAGAISVSSIGFIVFVNCEPGEDQELNEALLSDGTGSSLPLRRRRRMRFTIAHEIAHTFLYNLRGTRPEPLFALRQPASVRSVELICNRVAGVILLPGWWIIGRLPESDNLTPKRLRDLATEAIVSRETLVRRLRTLKPAHHPEAMLFCVRKEGSSPTIRAVSKHYLFRELFSDASTGAPLESVIADPDFLAFGGEQDSVERKIKLAGGGQLIFKFECEPNASKANASFLVVARPCG